MCKITDAEIAGKPATGSGYLEYAALAGDRDQVAMAGDAVIRLLRQTGPPIEEARVCDQIDPGNGRLRHDPQLAVTISVHGTDHARRKALFFRQYLGEPRLLIQHGDAAVKGASSETSVFQPQVGRRPERRDVRREFRGERRQLTAGISI